MGLRLHTVRDGESLSGIAAREMGNARLWPQLFAFNAGLDARIRHPLRNPDVIRVGQVIAIPPWISSRPPHLIRRAQFRHPFQHTRPVIAPRTAPALPRAAATPSGTPASGKSPRHGPIKATPKTATGFAGAGFPSPAFGGMTHVNSPAFKFDLDLVPPVKGALPGFDYEMKFVGQIYIWNDQQVDLLTFTNKAIESGAKLMAANTVAACDEREGVIRSCIEEGQLRKLDDGQRGRRPAQFRAGRLGG